VDFTNKNLRVLFTWGDTTVYLTESIRATWIVMGLLIAFTIVVRVRMRGFRGTPTGFQNFVETMVEMMSGFARETLGEELQMLNGYFFGVFAFVLFSNYIGMFGFRPPTSDLATTGALALITFFFSHFLGITRMKLRYLKTYIEPVPVFLPINLIGEIAKPLSLACRLFGNLLSGVIIVGLIYNLLPMALRFVFPTVIHGFFDVFVGALQTYVFTVLSMTFIRQLAAIEDN